MAPKARILSQVIMVAAALGSGAAHADVVYNSIPSPIAPNYPSQPYQAQQTAEFGDAVTLAGNQRALTGATVLMSDWAKKSDWPSVGTALGYFEPMTLTIYAAGSGTDPTPGAIVAQSSTLAFIPWRPEADPAHCGAGSTQFQGSDGSCYNGLATPVKFTFNGESVPDNVVFGLAFNTETYGANPTGVDGPYDSLNFALAPTEPTVGTDLDPNGVEWNTSNQGNLTSGHAGVFGPDVGGWTGFVPAVELDAIPEPATIAILLPAVLEMVATRRRRLGRAAKA